MARTKGARNKNPYKRSPEGEKRWREAVSRKRKRLEDNLTPEQREERRQRLIRQIQSPSARENSRVAHKRWWQSLSEEERVRRMQLARSFVRRKKRSEQRCSDCRQLGHTRRTCTFAEGLQLSPTTKVGGEDE